jgi:hypothetical protein
MLMRKDEIALENCFSSVHHQTSFNRRAEKLFPLHQESQTKVVYIPPSLLFTRRIRVEERAEEV